jgi:hypothetical protein
MATCSTVANVVGMIDTEAGLSVQLVRYVHLPLSTNWERTEHWYGDFDIAQQGGVTVFNIQRLVYRPFDIAWDAVCSHLLFILDHPAMPPPIRLQAARTLDDILVIVAWDLMAAPGDLQATVQHRVLDVLAQQIML